MGMLKLIFHILLSLFVLLFSIDSILYNMLGIDILALQVTSLIVGVITGIFGFVALFDREKRKK